jgi:hypothetical protein
MSGTKRTLHGILIPVKSNLDVPLHFSPSPAREPDVAREDAREMTLVGEILI